jgi:hypothetical protein
MVRFSVKSLGMLVVWTGVLMVFTSAGGSPSMLGALLLALCGGASLVAHARHGIARLPGTTRARQLAGGIGAPSTTRSSPLTTRGGP